MWSLGIMLLVVVLAVSAVAYFMYIRKKQEKALEKINELQVKRDTARILEEFKREQVDKSWEEFDRAQWELRFKNQG